jgi:hypothetical protein
VELKLQETASIIEIIWTVPCVLALVACGYVFYKFFKGLLAYTGQPGVPRLAAWLLTILSFGLTWTVFMYCMVGFISILSYPPPGQQPTEVTPVAAAVAIGFISNAFMAAIVSWMALFVYNKIVNYKD